MYSHTIPVAPAGSSVRPATGDADGVGERLTFRAQHATVAPDGHEDDAVVVVTVGGRRRRGRDRRRGVGGEPELHSSYRPEIALPHAARRGRCDPNGARDGSSTKCYVSRATPPSSGPCLRLPLVHYEASPLCFRGGCDDVGPHGPCARDAGRDGGAAIPPHRTPRGGGWRMFAEPVEVEAFVNEIWVPGARGWRSTTESAEIWARWPPMETHPSEDIHHQVIDASHYRAPAGGFPLSLTRALRGGHSGRHI